jgi:hypothetical protein
MKHLHEVLQDLRSGHELAWTRPDQLQRTYELCFGSDCLARIGWNHGWDGFAEVECAGDRWMFKHEGFLNARVRIFRNSLTHEAAILQHRWGRNSYLTFPDGSQFTWSVLSFWKGELGYKDQNGNVLLSFVPGYVKGKKAGLLKVEPKALELPNLSMLITLGWYLMVKLAQASAETVMIQESSLIPLTAQLRA